MEKRCATAERCSKETKIEVSLCLDGEGRIDVATGFGMLDHMLTLTFFWAGMDLTLRCKGDLEVDAHHTVEDCALVIGEAMQKALGDRAGIARVGYGRVPMDEALAEVTVDISGRPYTVWLGDDILPPVMAGEERDVWREWYKTLANTVRMNLHVSFLYGKNGHHLLESAAKGLGLALSQAVAKSGTAIRSTKGNLD
ncbi:imidazoleglycerol-phosphate dehydratase [Desulfovibrio sp. An276]|uniref:imidazoleglycerol-phosphate dehydratase n=1 Tax=Desulfovibrio sp. An276 TaxID=1965618 RepID=UPI000B3AB21F|nr:imidazoleglycerol-phosphate dehydratase [Desulfovibrio sp. An276]OUO54004.1 imidazoleglycerol-phosphate dehydratase [Desulfovibrio sp. An276]